MTRQPDAPSRRTGERPWRSASDLGGSSLPCAPACERNREPILAVLREVLAASHDILEIGSGTGQHAVFFARALPHLTWHTSDLAENHAAIRAWIAADGAANVREPLALDVEAGPWPARTFDGVFSANTAHIMSWPQVCAMLAGVGRILTDGGLFVLYGPFSCQGVHNSPSNEQFDAMLRARDPASGIRDIRELQAAAAPAGLVLEREVAMPANNRILLWRKAPA